MNRRIVLIAALLLMGAVLLPLQNGQAQGSTGPALDVRAGFDGYGKSGLWLPLSITASNTGNDISGHLRVSSASIAGGETLYTYPIDLPRGSNKVVSFSVPTNALIGNSITVDLVMGNGRVLVSDEADVDVQRTGALLVGLLSDTPGVMSSVGDLRPSAGVARLALLSIEDLPDTGRAWAALDVLAIYDIDSGQMSLAQREALHDWVENGGRLLVFGGTSPERTLAGLGDVVPVTVRDVVSADLSAFEMLAENGFNAQLATDQLVTSVSLEGEPDVLLADGNTPLALAWETGLGRVVFVAADPALEPLYGWDQQAAVWQSLLVGGPARPAWSYGFSEDWDSIRSAASAVPGLSLPSILQLCGFLVLYVMLVGPVNYLVLRALKKTELAWVTIPALVLVFSIFAYVTGFSLRGSTVYVHRISLVQTWPGVEGGRVEGGLGIWSPRRARYDIQFEPDMLARPMPLGYAGAALPTAGTVTVEQGGGSLIRDVRVDVGGVQLFAYEGNVASPPRIEGDVMLTPQSEGVRVQGDIINYSEVDLTHVSLVMGGAIQTLPDLPAGEVLSIDTLLVSGRSSSAGAASLDSYPANTYSYYYSGQYLNEALAGGSCYGVEEDNRRCNFVTSMLVGDARGDAVYLAGWSEQSPTGIEVLSGQVETIDLTLHIAELRSEFNPTVSLAQVPPFLTTWRVLEQNSNVYDATPYGLYMDTGGEITFRYEPFSGIDPAYAGLMLYVEAYGFIDNDADFYLHNFRSGEWDKTQVSSGENTINNPDYIDAEGGVEVRVVDGLTSYGFSLDRMDVTLLIEN